MLQPLPPSYPMPPLNTNPLTSACSLHADLFNCLCLSQCLSIVVCGVANLYLTIFCIRHCLCFCRSLHVVLFFSFALQSEFLFFRCFYVCLCHCHFFSQCTVLYLHLFLYVSLCLCQCRSCLSVSSSYSVYTSVYVFSISFFIIVPLFLSLALSLYLILPPSFISFMSLHYIIFCFITCILYFFRTE